MRHFAFLAHVSLLTAVLLCHCGQPEKPVQAPDTDLPAATTPPAADPGLYWEAALRGDAETVSSALAQGMNVDVADPDGRTALMLAAYDGHTAALEVLLDGAAAPDLQDAAGRTALMYAASGPNPDAIALLIARGAAVNIVDGGEKWTALMFAAAEGQAENVRILLAGGADPGMSDIDGETALFFARQKNFGEVVTLLEKVTPRR
jgi:uncharacterized protein